MQIFGANRMIYWLIVYKTSAVCMNTTNVQLESKLTSAAVCIVDGKVNNNQPVSNLRHGRSSILEVYI